MELTRRGFLASLAGAAATIRPRIKAVRAYPITLGRRFGGVAPKFASDHDPARWRYRGPLAQLAGAILVEVQTDQGVTGWGMGAGGAAAVAVIERHFRDLLVGTHALNVELLWDQLYTASSFYGRRGLVVMALSGVDLALWDIAGKVASRPVHELLGGATKAKVPSYYTGLEVDKAREMGFRAFKIPLREGVAEGKEGAKRIARQLEDVRKRIGPDADLMVECNSLWDVPYTLEMDRMLADLRPAFFEEPLGPDELEGYETLCREVRHTRIASGEHEYTRFGFHELIRHRAVHVLQPDITWSGGLTELRRIAALAASHSLPLLLHRGGSLWGLSLILQTPGARVAESFGILESPNELMAAMMPRFEAGYYYPPEKPGFGVEIDAALVRKFTREA